MGQYSIKEVETLSGVKAHTLRIWEQRYDFLKPQRSDTNIRYYTDDQLRMLLNIGTLNRSGMKISKIAELGQEELNKTVLNLYEEAHEEGNMLDSLIHAMLDFDETRFEKTLSSAILEMGFEKAFSQLVFPFLARTGVLWTTGAVSIAQEHFISHLIRKKLKVAIDSQVVQVSAKTKKFILFLPEWETHDVLLLFTDYILRKHNQRVIYLGAKMPLNEMERVIKASNPDYLVTFLTVPLDDMTLDSFTSTLLAASPSSKLILGGELLNNQSTIVPANCIKVNSVSDLLSAIA